MVVEVDVVDAEADATDEETDAPEADVARRSASSRQRRAYPDCPGCRRSRPHQR